MTKSHYTPPQPILIAGAGLNKLNDDASMKASDEVIQEAIDIAKGKMRRVDIDPVDIYNAADRAETRLANLGIPPSYRVGAILYMKPSGPRAKSYKYYKNTISVIIRRQHDGWYVIRINRSIVWPQDAARKDLMLTKKQLAIVEMRQKRLLEHLRDLSCSRSSSWRSAPRPKPAPHQGVDVQSQSASAAAV